MPTTTTPFGVFAGLLFLGAVAGVGFHYVLGFWGVVILLLVLAFTTQHYSYTTPPFRAVLLLNDFSGRQRAVFQGLSFKLPWEKPTVSIDLRFDLHETCKESYPSLDALMEVTVVFTIRPDVSGDAEANLIRYASYAPEVIARAAKALVAMLLSDYLGKKSGDELLNKHRIQQEIFGRGAPAPALVEFQNQHAVNIDVQIESVAFNAATQQFRNMVSGARSFSEAVQLLVKGGIPRAQAERTAKLMNLAGAKEYFLNLSAG